MNHQWTSQVSRALHLFGDAAPNAPSPATLLGRSPSGDPASESARVRERRTRRVLVACAASLVVIGIAGIAIAVWSSEADEDRAPVVTVAPVPTLGPTPTTVEDSVPSTSTVVDLEEFFSDRGLRRLPGPTYSAAGKYWWTGSGDFAGAQGTGAWMHNAQTQLYFTVRDDCFAEAPGSSPSAVTVAGLDGRYLEPYVGGAPWLDSRHGEATAGAYSLPIGDRTLCVYIWWDAATTPSKLQELRDIVESIRARPYDEHGVQVVFTLPEGWDTG